MQKDTIKFQGVDYPVRILDIRSIHSYEDERYAHIMVADTSLMLALGSDDCSDWSKEATAIDEKIFFYFSPKQLAKCSDKALIEELEVCL